MTVKRTELFGFQCPLIGLAMKEVQIRHKSEVEISKSRLTFYEHKCILVTVALLRRKAQVKDCDKVTEKRAFLAWGMMRGE